MIRILSGGVNTEQLELLAIAGGGARWGTHSKKELGSFI